MKNDKKITLLSPALEAASGIIPHKLTNDVIFHSTLQHSNAALKGLTCALLSLDPSVTKVEMMNPVDFTNYDGKELIMDVKVMVNDEHIANEEMQIIIGQDSTWWINRSLLYLCRCFDNLDSGDDYELIKPVTHISIVTQDLFPDEEPEFYAHYRLQNVRTHKSYGRNFYLNVLYLNHIDLASSSDKEVGLDHWARVMKADTWDELKEEAREHKEMREVVEAMLKVSEDKRQKWLAEAHDDYLSRITTFRNMGYREAKAEDAAELKAKDEAIAMKDETIAEQSQTIAEKDNIIAGLREQIAAFESESASKKN